MGFPDGVEIPVAGVALRAAGAPVTIRLVAGVGLDRMPVEQKRILRDYPDFLRRRIRWTCPLRRERASQHNENGHSRARA